MGVLIDAAIKPGFKLASAIIGAGVAAYAERLSIDGGLDRLRRDAERSVRRLDQMMALIREQRVPLASHIVKLTINNPALLSDRPTRILIGPQDKGRLFQLRDLIDNANRDVDELDRMLPTSTLASIEEKMQYTKDRFKFLIHFASYFRAKDMPQGARWNTPEILAYPRDGIDPKR